MKEESDTIFSSYFYGDLSSEEKIEFENKLAGDPDFKYQYDNFRIAKIAGERIHHNEVKSNVLAALNQEKKKKPKLIRFAVAAAAAIALLLAALFVFDAKPIAEQLYAKFYEAPPYSSSRTVQDSTDLWELSKTFFAQKKWSESISTIEKLDSSERSMPITKRMLAHALLNDHQIDRSISIFQQVKGIENAGDGQNDNWHIGLAYLKLPNLDSSIVYFEKVISGKKDFPHYKDALTMIPAINKAKK